MHCLVRFYDKNTTVAIQIFILEQMFVWESKRVIWSNSPSVRQPRWSDWSIGRWCHCILHAFTKTIGTKGKFPRMNSHEKETKNKHTNITRRNRTKLVQNFTRFHAILIPLSCVINFTRFSCVKWYSLIYHSSYDYRMIIAWWYRMRIAWNVL